MGLCTINCCRHEYVCEQEPVMLFKGTSEFVKISAKWLAILVTAICLSSTSFLHAQVQGTPAMNSKIETVATLTAPGGAENIGQGPDGSFYVTGLADRILWKISPNGQVDKFFTSPAFTAFLGVVVN